jgi:hypothetical protein
MNLPPDEEKRETSEHREERLPEERVHRKAGKRGEKRQEHGIEGGKSIAPALDSVLHHVEIEIPPVGAAGDPLRLFQVAVRIIDTVTRPSRGVGQIRQAKSEAQ